MARVIMEVHRSGYAPSQIRHTMTIGELIAELEQYDPESKIYTSHDDGYTYGGISWCDFTEREEADEE